MITIELFVTLFLAVLSSSLLSAFVTGKFNLHAKKSEYIQYYHKIVLERRITAYEELNKFIEKIKLGIVDIDYQPYHGLFSNNDEKEWTMAYILLFDAMSHRLWLSNDLYEKLRDLNVLLVGRNKSVETVIEFGKRNYQTIINLRVEIEHICAVDMINLYNVEEFLISKKNILTGFSEVKISHE